MLRAVCLSSCHTPLVGGTPPQSVSPAPRRHNFTAPPDPSVPAFPKPSPEWIAERLRAGPPAYAPEDLHLGAIPAGARVTDAAVMVPLVHRADGVQLLLTQRTAHLSDHAGQISFPGGRVEPEDASREETALRETEEEIGLGRAHIQLLGRLPEYEIPSGFRITPVV